MSRAFDDIRTGIEAQVIQAKKIIKLAVGPIFASRWLIPRLNRFRRQHPDIELVLLHGPRIAGVENMTTDVAVDWGEGSWSGLVSNHLLNISYSPILSPHLAKQKGGFKMPADLVRFTVLHHIDRSEWGAWLELAESSNLAFVDESVIKDSNVILQAAIDGQGVALGTFPFVQSEVDNGQLICPLNISLNPTRSYHLLTRVGARKNAEVEAVCQWLVEEARGSRLN
ncbi:MAG: LysR family glycine cleavage system transcriptional activator [Gammaproteobacteria bacterium]